MTETAVYAKLELFFAIRGQEKSTRWALARLIRIWDSFETHPEPSSFYQAHAAQVFAFDSGDSRTLFLSKSHSKSLPLTGESFTRKIHVWRRIFLHKQQKHRRHCCRETKSYFQLRRLRQKEGDNCVPRGEPIGYYQLFRASFHLRFSEARGARY